MNSACGDKPVLIGGVGEINFGKQFRQGNRVYSSEHVAMCLLSQPVGNAGGNSYLYVVDDNTKNDKGYYCLRYQRTEYAKKIRKQYESGEIKERRCSMREYTTRDDDCCNTLTTVTKDNYILEVQCAAMRGRYNSDGKIEQQLELGSSDHTHALTTVSKDNYIIEKRKE